MIDSVNVSYAENKSSMSVRAKGFIFELGTTATRQKPLENIEYDFQFETLKSCSLHTRSLGTLCGDHD